DAEADDLHVTLVELRLQPGGVAELGGADGGEILRVREQHGPVAVDVIVEADAAFGGLGLEIGSGIADENCHENLLSAGSPADVPTLSAEWGRRCDGRA